MTEEREVKTMNINPCQTAPCVLAQPVTEKVKVEVENENESDAEAKSKRAPRKYYIQFIRGGQLFLLGKKFNGVISYVDALECVSPKEAHCMINKNYELHELNIEGVGVVPDAEIAPNAVFKIILDPTSNKHNHSKSKKKQK